MRTTAALLSLLLLAACARYGSGGSLPGPSTISPTELRGAWQLDHGTGPGGALQIPAGSEVTIAFEGERVSGRVCNLYGGTYRLGDGGQLTLSAMGMTEMACAEPIMSLEAAYHAALGLVKTATVDGEELTLHGDGVELVFRRVPPVADADLVGTRWTLSTLLEGDVASSVQGDAWLQLAPDGTLRGATGCRGFDGSYAVDADQLRVSDLVVADNACEATLDAQDRLVLDVLRGGLRYDLAGRQLTLTDAGGVGGRGLVYSATGS
ncbi:MAG TPA: META domain-containing protein [Candidatus Limnocylindria bacterium]|jgi:heat shock protein HslJ